MAKSRKRVFPKPPVRFHSKLEKELGRWSNKVGFDASVKAIYNQELKAKQVETTSLQDNQLERLRRSMSKTKG